MSDEQPIEQPKPPSGGNWGWAIIAAIGVALSLYAADRVVEALQPVMPEIPAHVVSVTVAPPPVMPPVEHVPPAQYEEAIGPSWQATPVPPAKPPARKIDGIGRVALVIDDCGMSTAQTLPAMELPKEATLSFLPWGYATKTLAPRAKAEGFDVMLHMPMQPRGNANPGDGAIMLSLPPAENAARLEAGLTAVPDAIGMNNHMGSAATADSAAMQAVMGQLQQHAGLFFLDSYTTGGSVAYRTAREHGIRAVRRDVFLDDDMSRAAVDIQLERLVAIAHKQGAAIAIGHPHPDTLAALKEWLAKRGENGIELVRLKTLVEETDEPK